MEIHDKRVSARFDGLVDRAFRIEEVYARGTSCGALRVIPAIIRLHICQHEAFSGRLKISIHITFFERRTCHGRQVAVAGAVNINFCPVGTETGLIGYQQRINRGFVRHLDGTKLAKKQNFCPGFYDNVIINSLQMFRVNCYRAQFQADAVGDTPGDILLAVVITAEPRHKPQSPHSSQSASPLNQQGFYAFPGRRSCGGASRRSSTDNNHVIFFVQTDLPCF